MIEAINCKQGSAWHNWQNAGADWLTTTHSTSDVRVGDIKQAADLFANVEGFNGAGIDARYRAFREGATIAIRQLTTQEQ